MLLIVSTACARAMILSMLVLRRKNTRSARLWRSISAVDARRRALDAVVERMLLDDEDRVVGRVGGEGGDQFVDEGGVAAVAGMDDELRVARLLQQRQEHLAPGVGELQRAREHVALVMGHAPQIFAEIAEALAIDGIAVIAWRRTRAPA